MVYAGANCIALFCFSSLVTESTDMTVSKQIKGFMTDRTNTCNRDRIY